MQRIKKFIGDGSGWSVWYVINVVLHFAAYRPTTDSSYIKTPNQIAMK